MPPSLIVDLPPEEPRNRVKNGVRILIHLCHLFITLLLFFIVIAGFVLPENVHYPYNLYDPYLPYYNLYLIPLAVYNLVFTLAQLFKIDRRKFLPRPLNFGIFAHIRFRAYLYQVAAAIPLAQGDAAKKLQIPFAFIVWIIGLGMFILGCTANEFGFRDWVQEVQEEEEEEGRVRLPMSSDDEEDLFENPERRGRRKDGSRRAKRLVRNAVHVWDLLTVFLLVPIALIGSIPRDWPYDSLGGIYLIPFIVYSFAYAILWLFKKKQEEDRSRAKVITTFLTRRQFGFFSRIRVRGLIYQVFAVISLSHSRRFIPEEADIAGLVWNSGAMMFILGCIASECGFLDWLQEEEGKEDSTIGLFDSSDEDDEESNAGDHENTARATGEPPDALPV